GAVRQVAAIVAGDRRQQQRYRRGRKEERRVVGRELADAQKGDGGDHHGEHGAEKAVLDSGRAVEPALGEMHVAEQDGDQRGDRRRAPQEGRRRGEVAVFLFARGPFERKQRDDDAYRNVQNEDVKTTQEVDEIHVPETFPRKQPAPDRGRDTVVRDQRQIKWRAAVRQAGG